MSQTPITSAQQFEINCEKAGNMSKILRPEEMRALRDEITAAGGFVAAGIDSKAFDAVCKITSVVNPITQANLYSELTERLSTVPASFAVNRGASAKVTGINLFGRLAVLKPIGA